MMATSLFVQRVRVEAGLSRNEARSGWVYVICNMPLSMSSMSSDCVICT